MDLQQQLQFAAMPIVFIRPQVTASKYTRLGLLLMGRFFHVKYEVLLYMMCVSFAHMNCNKHSGKYEVADYEWPE